jgi:hypothetical protein
VLDQGLLAEVYGGKLRDLSWRHEEGS